MKKTLYITDLDGTFLNKNGELSHFSKKAVNTFIEKGGLFSVATARSPQSTQFVMDSINFNLPIALISGVFIYDAKKRKELITHFLSYDLVVRVEDILDKLCISGFIYTFEDNAPKIYFKLNGEEPYTGISNIQQFHEAKRGIFETRSLRESALGKNVIHIMLHDSYQTLKPVADRLHKINNLNFTFYEDVYTPNAYFMEIFSGDASKGIAAEEIKRIAGADEIVAFGDNYNDIPLLKTADRGYVTANGVNDAKNIATDIIGYCHEDAVAKFILKENGIII